MGFTAAKPIATIESAAARAESSSGMYVNPGSARVSLLASTLYGLLCIALQEQQTRKAATQV
jgi:hypothetical protein